ncbi:MAG: hypothetical protein DRI69_11190 [Bacteroidetes bacterium]|nr:MAG: hypothetical protein DRI69_11190 [Bacteroidota bacterium]
MKNLSDLSNSWIKQMGYSGFESQFLDQASDASDLTNRVHSLEIAVRWCIDHPLQEDAKLIPHSLKDYLSEHIQVDEFGYESIDSIWQDMCQNVAHYSFVEIDEFDVTKALYGIYRSLLQADKNVEPIDQICEEKLLDTFEPPPEANADKFSIPYRLAGLDSEVAPWPKGHTGPWTDFANFLRTIITPTN